MLNGPGMMMKRARIVTTVSWFLAPLTIASCLRIRSTGGDDSDGPIVPDAYVTGTSLAGQIPCGSFTCPSGSLCTHWSGGIDAGVPDAGGDAGVPPDPYENLSCSTVPTSCRIYNCDDLIQRCSPCISELCSSGSYLGYGISVIGRDLYCPGQ